MPLAGMATDEPNDAAQMSTVCARAGASARMVHSAAARDGASMIASLWGGKG
jgi:hypothetical protein